MSRAGVDLLWIPLGAGVGGGLVRGSGRAYEALLSRRAGRPPQRLFHSALEVHVAAGRYVVEMAPVWSLRTPDRGVVREGPVGHPWLGRSRLFRYEVRRWHDGVLPDAAYAVGGPCRLTDDSRVAEQLLADVPSVPALTWGRDELGTGDMWNSNSLTSWLLAGCGERLVDVPVPDGGRAPGWAAGLAARRSSTAAARGDLA